MWGRRRTLIRRVRSHPGRCRSSVFLGVWLSLAEGVGLILFLGCEASVECMRGGTPTRNAAAEMSPKGPKNVITTMNMTHHVLSRSACDHAEEGLVAAKAVTAALMM